MIPTNFVKVALLSALTQFGVTCFLSDLTFAMRRQAVPNLSEKKSTTRKHNITSNRGKNTSSTSSLSIFENQLKVAKELRHHRNQPDDVKKAEAILINVAQNSTSPAQISEAYLGLTKISFRRNDIEAGRQYARTSFLKGNPNDLRTLIFLCQTPDLNHSERVEYAEKILSLSKNDLNPNDSLYLNIARAYAYLTFGNLRIDRKDNYLQALKIAREEKDLLLEAQILMTLGNAHIDGKRNFLAALKIAHKLEDPSLEAQALIGLGNVGMRENQNFEAALEIAQKIGDLTLQAQALIGLGNSRINREENYSEALNIARKIGDEMLQFQALMGLGNAHINGRVNFQDALDIAIKLDDRTLQFQAHMGLGNAHLKQESREDLEFRVENYKKALTIAREMGDRTFEVKALIGLGNAKSDREQNYTEALKIAQELGDRTFQFHAYMGLGHALINGQQNYSKAFEIATQLNDKSLQAKARTGLGHFHRANNDRGLAVFNYKKALDFLDPKSKEASKLNRFIRELEQNPNRTNRSRTH